MYYGLSENKFNTTEIVGGPCETLDELAEELFGNLDSYDEMEKVIVVKRINIITNFKFNLEEI